MMTQMRMEIEKSLSLFRGTAEETRCDIIFAEHSGWCHSGYLSQRSQTAVMYFFKAVYLLASKTQNFGPLWPVWAIVLQIYAFLLTFHSAK